MDSVRFDELIRNFATRQGSRRRLAAGLVVGLVGGSLAPFARNAAANATCEPNLGDSCSN
jgi:hypothetical protein